MGTAALFESRAAEGRDAESRVLDVFVKAGWRVQWRMYRSRKDLEVGMPNGTEFIEVKNEDKYAHSGNICVEIYQGNPSRFAGMLDSEATVCVHTLRDECIAYRRNQMVKEILLRYDSGEWVPQLFRGADNHNGGFILSKAQLLAFSWVDRLPLVQLPQSRLFHPR